MSLAGNTPNNNSKIRAIFYCPWLILSILQAAYSNLIPDEAYYWTYSRHLAWGYFDHPPVIALMIRLGYSVFHNEIGVRLLSIVCTMLTIYITERITQPKNLLLFYMSVASLAVLHIAGILAVPDIPLLFFTATFFWLYKHYTEQQRPYLIILLAVNIALLLLSKYHGILILFFTLLSNLKLLRKPSFWAIVALSIVLFFPHILWQQQYEYPSLKYHLSERNRLSYNIIFTLNYLAAIPLVFAPLTGMVMLFFSLRHKAKNSLEKAMSYCLRGILLFFFIMSFRGPIEANWILFTIIPALCLGYNTIMEKKWGPVFIRRSFIFSIILILVARTILVDGLWNLNIDTSGWKQWAAHVQKQASNRPVAFMNSYQKAAEYEFYSGARAFPLNNIMHRRDQYNIFNYENEVQGKDIMLIPNFPIDSMNSFETSKGTLQYSYISNFRSASNILINTRQKELNLGQEDNFPVDLSFGIQKGSSVDAEANPAYPMYISYRYFNDRGYVSEGYSDLHITNTMLKNGLENRIIINSPPGNGDFRLLISVSAGWLPGSINGANILVHKR